MPAGDLPIAQRDRTVNPYPLSLPASVSAGKGDINWPVLRRQQPPQRRGTAVTEDGGFTCRQDRRHPLSLVARCGVADGIDATVEAVQTTSTHTSQHSRLADAGLSQLVDVNDAVLAPGNGRNSGIRGAFPAHTVVKAPGPADSPPTSILADSTKVLQSAILRVSLVPRPGVFSCNDVLYGNEEKWLAEMSASR